MFTSKYTQYEFYLILINVAIFLSILVIDLSNMKRDSSARLLNYLLYEREYRVMSAAEIRFHTGCMFTTDLDIVFQGL